MPKYKNDINDITTTNEKLNRKAQKLKQTLEDVKQSCDKELSELQDQLIDAEVAKNTALRTIENKIMPQIERYQKRVTRLEKKYQTKYKKLKDELDQAKRSASVLESNPRTKSKSKENKRLSIC